MAAVYNFTLDRGASLPLAQWAFPYDFTGSSFEIVIKLAGGELLTLSTEDGSLGMDVRTGISVVRDGVQTDGNVTTLTWAYTPEQSRLIIRAEYEMQHTDAVGGQAIPVRGTITGTGGLNND